MNGRLYAAAVKTLREENARFGVSFVELPIPPGMTDPQTIPCSRVWRSCDYLVQLYDEGDWLRLSICRALLRADGRWVDGLSWDDLMAVKRGVGFGDRFAVEVYPRDENVVNVANMRHLWISKDEAWFLGWLHGSAAPQ